MNVLQPGISARGLTKRFGDHLVVDDANFDVLPGHVTGFLGPNGAGKSTTLQMILGLTGPSSGTASILGRPLSAHRNPASAVGACLDTGRLLPGLTVRGHLDWIARATGTDTTRIDAGLDRVGIRAAAGKRIAQLSLGMRQRLGIAAALLADPRVLILDEPFNGLDPEGIGWLRNFLADFAREGRTVLVSSHLLREMEQTADHVIIIRAGTIIADLPLAELRDQAKPRVRLRGPNLDPLARELRTLGTPIDVSEEEAQVLVDADDPGEIFRTCVRLGVELTELTLEKPDLEDIFMAMTTSSATEKES